MLFSKEPPVTPTITLAKTLELVSLIKDLDIVYCLEKKQIENASVVSALFF